MNRLEAITHCMDRLEECRIGERDFPHPISMIGTLDWLQELHQLIHKWETGMEFEKLRSANARRLPQFKNRQGKPAHSQPDGHDWSIAEWTNAMAGEAGEACNVAKKIIRGDYGDDIELGIGELLDEIADVVIYADLVCQRVGRRLEISVVNKFNEVSERVGSDVRL